MTSQIIQRNYFQLTWSCGTSLVTCLHCLWGSMVHSSWGFSLTTVLVMSWHSSGPWSAQNVWMIVFKNLTTNLSPSTISWSTQFCWFLVAPGHGCVLGHRLGLLGALLSRPLLALLGCLVSLSDVLALLLLNSLATNYVVLDLVSRKYLSVLYVCELKIN